MVTSKFRAVFGTAIIAASLAIGFGARAETLTDALISAYKNSRLLEQNRAVLRASDENVAQSMAALRPVINFVANFIYQDPPNSAFLPTSYETYGLQATMTLYDFGRSSFTQQAARETVLATQQALVGIEQQVLLSAVSAFMSVRNAEEVVAINQSNVRVIGQELKATQDRFDVGEVTRTDIAQAQASLALAQSQLVSAQGNLTVAREAFKLAVGSYPVNLKSPASAPKLPASLADARAIAERNHPSILQAQHQVAAAEQSLGRARANMRPNLTATAQFGNSSLKIQSQSFGMTLSQTLYAGGSLSSQARAAMANLDAAKAGLLQSVLTVDQGVGQAWSQVTVAQASIVAFQRQVTAAQTAFDGVREEAKLGSQTTLDVLNSEQTLLNAKASLIGAQTGQYTAFYALMASMGLLTVEHLKLGIPTYDPSVYYNAVKNGPALSSQGAKLDRILKGLGDN